MPTYLYQGHKYNKNIKGNPPIGAENFQKTCIDFSIRNVRPTNGILISKAKISTLNKKVLGNYNKKCLIKKKVNRFKTPNGTTKSISKALIF